VLRTERGNGHVTAPPERRRAPGAGWLVAGVPALTALALGGYELGQAPLWRDEAATKEVAGRSVSQILATLPNNDVVHGAYYLVIHAVMAVGGSSATALRLPSLIAMAVASAFTALIARGLVANAGGPFPGLTGVAAGFCFAILPSTIGYAQEARSYAMVTMLATITTYLLVRADRDRRWWPAYGAAVLLTGLFNLFGALVVAAHGVSLLLARRRAPGGARWLITSAIAGLLLLPVVYITYAERGALGWMAGTIAWWPNFTAFLHSATGTGTLTAPVLIVAAAGVGAEAIAARGRLTLGPAAVAVPWFLLPPVFLLTVSQVHSMWDIRYVEFCLPASSILLAWGLNWVTRLARATVLRPAAWVPLAVVPLALLTALEPAQASTRHSRPDNLQAEAGIIARNARPGDVIFYWPINDRIVSMPYPGPFRQLRDLALASSPVTADDLYGTDVTPGELARRFTHVTRVWVVTSSEVSYFTTNRVTPVDTQERHLIAGMRMVHAWRDGDTELILYAR
jgi:mannosyltransferase